MCRLVLCILFGLAALVVSLTAASADPWQLSDAAWPERSAALSSDCHLGNTGPFSSPAEVLPFPPFVPFEICILVDPQEGCSQCGMGVSFSSITATILSVVLQCELSFRARVREVQSVEFVCDTMPGDVVCESNAMPMTFEDFVTDFEVPLTCSCARRDFQYFVCVEVTGPGCGSLVGRFGTDSIPLTPCTNFIALSNGGFMDEALGGLRGPLTLFASTQCCDQPIPVVPSSWGAIKGAFDAEPIGP